MEDKIVILEDLDGNNIYPISRGLATNSVDTNAIQNGAVTSAKIDWTTMRATFSGVTDSLGFLSVPRSVVAPSTGIIFGARLNSITTGSGDYGASFIDILTNYNDAITHDVYALRLKNWNDTAWDTKAVTVDILYATI